MLLLGAAQQQEYCTVNSMLHLDVYSCMTRDKAFINKYILKVTFVNQFNPKIIT